MTTLFPLIFAVIPAAFAQPHGMSLRPDTARIRVNKTG